VEALVSGIGDLVFKQYLAQLILFSGGSNLPGSSIFAQRIFFLKFKKIGQILAELLP
jgi:hypothetical protein